MLEWAAISFSRGFPDPGNEPASPVLQVKWSESRSAMFDSLWLPGQYSPWNSPGKNTGVDCLSLLQGIFPTQGSNLGLPHCGQFLYQLSHKGTTRPTIAQIQARRAETWYTINLPQSRYSIEYVIKWNIVHRPKKANGINTEMATVQFSCSVVSNSLQPQGLQHTKLPWPLPTPSAYSNSHLLSRWCHPTISSSVVPFSSCRQSFPASESFPVSQLFTWCGQSTGVSASASDLSVNIQDWSPSEWTGWISLQFRGLSRVFSNTTVQKHKFFGTQLSLQSNSHIHTWLLEKP